jgi:hypothetical protein
MYTKIDLPCGFHGHIVRLSKHHRMLSVLVASSCPCHSGQKRPRHASRRVPGRNGTRMTMGEESSSREEHVTPMLLPVSAIDFTPINSTSAASPVPHHPDRKQPSHACPACPWQTRYQDDVGRNHIPTQIIPVRNSRDDAWPCVVPGGNGTRMFLGGDSLRGRSI